ncbi:hypothetical protein AGDE_15006 [Angomonas deanei]|uniref:Nucleotidyltransferase domain containing protein, putative n=1 Tax=Angomonas deanei TaxID=59799 RepID=A0A7G2CNT0_9TRYP|nr:hypothetical protein AGDE_15006 [Angomonas deanei]CAD2220203.1 Nucleotidyltransferase domain containing protein, putative [Angomonas deanei]|eukprot:EPY19845.1 hypothetical protein AGDE_15006 [Angomonas deanei]
MNNNNMNNSAPNSNNNNTGLMGNTPTGPTLFPFAPTVPLYDFLSVLPYFIESCLLLTEEEYARREKLFQNIEAIAKSYLTFQTELRVHGSVTTGLALPSSDIDLLMIHYNPPFMPLEALKTLATAIVFADDVLLSEALARKRMVEEEEREATHLLRTIGRGDNMFLQVEEEEQAKEAPQEGRSDSDSPPRVPSSLASPIPDRQHPAVLDREGSYPFILLGEKEEMESSQRVERSRPDHGEMSSNNNNNSSSSAVGQEAIKTFNELVRQNKKSSKDRKEEEGEGSADHSSDPDSDDEEKDEEDDPTDTVHYTTKEEVHAAERIFRRQIEKEYEFTAQRDVLKAVSSLFQQSSAMRPQEEQQKPHSGSDSSGEEGSELDANDDTKHFDEEEVMALPPKEGTSTPARTVVCPPPPLPPAPPQLFTSTLDPNSTRGRRQVPVIEGQLYTVQAILTTRVPVIKMVEKETHMKADITFAGGDHYRSMKLIQSLVERYPHSQYFILFFKYCVQCLQIGEHAEGGVTSFVVYLLVMHFFNTCEQRVVQSLVEQEEEVAARKTSADTTTTVTVQTNLTDNSNVELRTGDSHNNNNDNRPPPNTNTNTNNKTGMNCLQGIVDSFFKKNHKNVANQDQTAIEQTILSFLGEEHSKNSSNNNNNGEDDRVSNSSRIGSPSTLKTISDGEHQEGFPAVQAEPKKMLIIIIIRMTICTWSLPVPSFVTKCPLPSYLLISVFTTVWISTTTPTASTSTGMAVVAAKRLLNLFTVCGAVSSVI